MEPEKNDKPDKPLFEIPYNAPVIEPGKPMKLEELIGLIPTVSTAPTHTPTKFIEQIRIYKNGATLSVYIYDVTNGAWRSVNLT